jgi:predicted small secreted protein
MMRRSLFAFLLVVAILLAGCGSGKGNKKQASATAAPAVPDLAVTRIALSPAQIGVGQSFTIQVYVANLGGTASGSYDLTINLRDVTRGTTSPIGTQQGQSLAPGDEVLAY